MVSLPILVKVISGTMRLTVAIKIPEVDDMMARAQEKVDAIKRAKERTGELWLIDEVIFAQNVPKYNPEWEHSPNGRATSYLATLVCRYMHNFATKGQESHIECKGIRDYLSYSQQFDWEVDFGETVPWWIRPGTGTRQGGSRRKGVALQEEKEITTMSDGPRKDKQ